MLSVRGQFGGKYQANTVHNEGGSCFKSRQPGNLPEFGHGPCLPTSPWPILDRVATFWARLSLNVALFELRGQLLSDKLHRVDRAWASHMLPFGVLPVSLCSYDLLLEMLHKVFLSLKIEVCKKYRRMLLRSFVCLLVLCVGPVYMHVWSVRG